MDTDNIVMLESVASHELKIFRQIDSTHKALAGTIYYTRYKQYGDYELNKQVGDNSPIYTIFYYNDIWVVSLWSDIFDIDLERGIALIKDKTT